MGVATDIYTHIMQAFITLALVASASAAPQLLAAHGVAHPVAHAVAHPVVHAAPVVAHAVHPVAHAVAAPDLAEPSPYTYTYAVADDYSKANFQQSESNDGTGAVTGSYSVNLPDGRIQTVTYNANDLTGNVAPVVAHAVHAAPVVAHAAPVVAHAVHAAPVVAHATHRVVAHAVHAAPVVAHATHGVVAHG